MNLIKTVRELSLLMEDIANGLRSAAATAATTTTSSSTQQQSSSSSFGMGLFGTATTVQPSSTSSGKKNLDMEYALLGFTQMQRQIASECLFYLAYHTQLTVGEVTSILDLVKELTNGGGWGNNNGSIGLPLLDPLLMDVP